VAPRGLVGGYFIPEDGGNIFLRKVVPSYKSTRKHNPEVHHLHRSRTTLLSIVLTATNVFLHAFRAHQNPKQSLYLRYYKEEYL
jgi:hypothetical protein